MKFTVKFKTLGMTLVAGEAEAEWEKVLRVFGEGECLDDLREIV